MKIGPEKINSNKYRFVVWAPEAKEINLKILKPDARNIKMARDQKGYWSAEADNIKNGTAYMFSINNEMDRPDPASNFQAEDVHGPSYVVDHQRYSWNDSDWKGILLTRYVIYELHIGTFTPEGTFESAISKLDYLKELGITAVEIMPVAQFPGGRNWGYDGVYPYAPQSSYGGPEGLKRLIDACHQKGMAAVLDVVYNHFGPSGNYLSSYAPYFTDRYKTPWGMAVNFDGEFSDEVRNYFIQNALYWFTEYHFDALRLDAVHSIYDFSAKPFLQELADFVHEYAHNSLRKCFLIAESDLNDSKIIKPSREGGYGFDAQWSDDFHHALHALLTGESAGYYSDFGETSQLSAALQNGWVYGGDYSQYRKRRHGNSTEDLPADRFIVCIQNHDQVGNRAFGERLAQLLPFEALKLAAGVMMISPYIPMLFMGEEFGAANPFLYFVSHTEPELVEAVQSGRIAEFSAFKWQADIPDPQDKGTFERSKLPWEKLGESKNGALMEFYKNMLDIRKQTFSLQNFDRNNIDISDLEEEKIIFFHRHSREDSIYAIMNFSNIEVNVFSRFPQGEWEKVLDSSDRKWLGRGSAAPDRINNAGEITLNEFSLLLYKKI